MNEITKLRGVVERARYPDWDKVPICQCETCMPSYKSLIKYILGELNNA